MTTWMQRGPAALVRIMDVKWSQRSEPVPKSDWSCRKTSAVATASPLSG
jgi:hypothetical protein